jgi:long-chain acyl-CoA synthetase
MGDSIPQRLQQTAHRYADQAAFRLAGHEVSFREIDRQSTALACWLQQQGLQQGDRVGLYCPNSDDFAVVYGGILKAGGVVVPLNLLQGPQELAFVCADAAISGLFYHDLFSAQVEAFTGGLDDLKFQVRIGAAADSGQPGLAALLAKGQTHGGKVELSGSDPAVILYTSGTTGRPKGALLSHANLLANCSSVFRALELRPGEDVILVVLPMFHAFAATVGMLTPLLHGLTIAPVERFDPQLVTDRVEATGATVFLGVPSMYNLLSRLPEQQVARWHSVRFGVAGGAAMPVELLQRFEQRFGFPLLEGDGPTECSPVTCVNPLRGVRKLASVGVEIPDVEIAVMDGQGGVLPPGEPGELCVRGPNVMQGYWNLPEETAAVFFGDWLRTGDLGYKDEEGYIFMVDRIKDMIIVNGMNVYPRMIEEVLYTHESVQEAAVVGEPHGSHGEIPVAHVVLRQGASLDSTRLRAYCSSRLAGYQTPRKFFFVESLPKNAAGKILKRELRKQGELERGIDSRREPPQP